MRYWPISTIRNSPLMPAAFFYELDNVDKCGLTGMAFNAAASVANRTPAKALPNTVIVQNTPESPLNFIYTGYPAPGEWEALERSAFAEWLGDLWGVRCIVH